MPGPIRHAKKFSEFTSFNQLARALLDAYPKVTWGVTSRSLGNKLGELDKGTTTWWRNNLDKANCLAEFLELSLEDLGLHEKADGIAFLFQEFPELPPLDLKRDETWQIGFEELDPIQVLPTEVKSKPTLDHWLGQQPVWGRPPTEFDWLWVPDDLHRRLLARKLSASGHYEVVFAETLAAAASRLRNSKPVIVAVEQNLEGEDLTALAERPEDAGILIIASFMWAPREETSSAELTGWEARAARGKERRKFDLSAKRWAFHNAVQRWELKKLPDWRERLLAWVGRRLNRCDVDTHFSARAVEEWLKSFDPSGLWFCTTSDLMQLCRLVHRDSEKRLPKSSDPEAGARLARLLFERESVAMTFFIEQLAASRWQSNLPWEGTLSLKEWLETCGGTGGTVSRSDLDDIVVAKTVGDRTKAADRVAALLDTGNPGALLGSGLLKEVKRGAFDYQHRTFARLLVRDTLIGQIANDSSGVWALNCFDPTRRPLVDAALDAVPIDSLVKAADRLDDEFADSAQSIAAAEALFIAIGKRIARQQNIPATLHSVAKQVTQHLDLSEDSDLVSPWSRPIETSDDQLAWVCACWSWSLLPEALADGVPKWLFPGWAKELPEIPYWIEQLVPEEEAEDTSPAFRAFWEVLVEWAKEIDSPSESWPTVMVAPFLLKAAKGGLPSQSAWWKKLLEQKWAEKLLLECYEEVGKDAASRVWPSFVIAEREVATESSAEGKNNLRLISFQYSRIRSWLLKHLKPVEVLRGLSKDDLAYLARLPETLPPDVRADLLLEVRDCLPIQWPWEGMNFLARFGLHSARALEAFLEHEVLGDAAVEYLWRWNAERALVLLAEKGAVTATVQSALYWHCPQQHFPQALGLLANDFDVFDREERQRWIRKYLPNAGEHAVRALELLKAE